MTDATSGRPTTPLADVEVLAGAERPMLSAFLDYYRTVLIRKIEGISEAQARSATCPPSDMSLLGLVRHMADVERIWAQRQFSGGIDEPIFYGNAHPTGDPDGDFHPPPEATIADAVSALRAQAAAADAIYAAADLDDVEKGGEGKHSVRWILVHLIEEYARHCGHADLLRQAVDGAVGD